MAYHFPSYDPNATSQFNHTNRDAWNGNSVNFPCSAQEEPQNQWYQNWVAPPQPSPEQQQYNQRSWQPNYNNQRQQFKKNYRRNNNKSYGNFQRGNIPNMSNGGNFDHNGHPNTSSFACEPCERKFTSEGDYLAHSKSHVECHFEGCNFTAAKKVVTLHFIKNHEVGKFRISLDTPEEIQKWIADRKKSFPTKENIERKRLINQQKKEAGATMDNKSFKYRNQQCIRCNGKKRGSRGRRGRGGRGRFGSDDNGCSCWRSGLNDNDYRLLLGTGNKSDAGNEIQKLTDNITAEKPGGLGLLSSYGSDDENVKSETEGEENGQARPPAVAAAPKPDQNKPKTNRQQISKQNKRTRKEHRDNQNHLTKRRRHGNLLEMLLANDIRRERNLILQCIRYIVNNNFFEEPTPSAD